MASSGTEALNRMAESIPDIVILDVMLPDIDGFEVCRRLRSSHTNVPILMLTARSAVADKVDGFDCGADDYLTKPFDFEELLARVRARLRQEAHPHSLTKKIIVGDLVIDPASRQVWRADQLIELTKREYDLLEVLARNTGQVITQGIFFQRVWGGTISMSGQRYSKSLSGPCARN